VNSRSFVFKINNHMETNTAILPLAEYNRLRDFEKKILAGDVIKIHSLYRDGYYIISKDDAVKELATEIDNLKQFADSIVPKHNELVDVKKMSWSEFRKWRKQ